MERPYCCPVCKGAWLVNCLPEIAGDQPTWSDSGTSSYICEACQGTGIIWRGDAA